MELPNITLTLDQLRAWVENSVLAHKVFVIYMTNDLNEIISGIDLVRKDATAWEESMQRPLLVVVSMLYLIRDTTDPPTNMRGLLCNMLAMLDTIDPMSVHGHLEYLLAELSRAGAAHCSNIYRLAMAMVRAPGCGMPMGVCLLWSILGEVINLEITMHRYREFKELAENLSPECGILLSELNIPQLNEMCLLVLTINRILELVVLQDNNDLKQFGYPDHFFQMRRVDVESMLSWATTLLCQLHLDFDYQSQLGNQLNAMTALLNRVNLETVELVEEVEEPEQFAVETDSFSDLDD